MVSDNNDNKEDNIIRGKALYFSTSQVSSVLNEADSKIRYYTNVFDEILHIEISNKQRRYTEADIDKLRFIIELKNEGMTIKQIQEYCQEVNFEDSKEIQIKENNPLSIQTMAKALLEQQAILIEEMKKDIINSVVNEVIRSLSEQKNDLNSDIAITVEETVNKQLDNFKEDIQQELALTKDTNKQLSQKLEDQSQQIQNNFDNMSTKIIKENTKMINDFKYVKLEKEFESKSFLSKLFHKSH